MALKHKNQSVNVHQFAMAPRADIPRSSFRVQKGLKTTFDGGLLIPVYVDEVLPGDTFRLSMTAFARLSTPLFPFMDNLHLDSFFFFVPNRLVWTNWVRFMGQQASPTDSISFVVPQVVSPAGGWAIQSLHDYFGLPTIGQVAGGFTVSVNSLPLRAYNKIWHDWFRDENLQNAPGLETGDGPDAVAYNVLRRGKRHDYFTSCLPFTQKGTVTPLIISGVAPVTPVETPPNAANIPLFRTASVATPASIVPASAAIAANLQTSVASSAESWQWTTQTGLEVDLANATANTINQLRQAFQIQKLLERDARGGTRYTEIVRSHFGVISPDARLQRAEYLGGSSAPITVNPIAQTAVDASGAVGDLGAAAAGLLRSGFSQSFTEHGYIIGLISARADLTYQQGLRKMWSRSTRYDFYFPVFAALGEQAVLTKEIYCTGDPAIDNDVFGYQERWAEYRYNPSEITGYFRSTAANTLDAWHLAQEFSSQPVLNAAFIADTPPIARVVAATGNGFVAPQFLLDCFFDITEARPMPLYSVPGMIDHF